MNCLILHSSLLHLLVPFYIMSCPPRHSRGSRLTNKNQMIYKEKLLMFKNPGNNLCQWWTYSWLKKTAKNHSKNARKHIFSVVCLQKCFLSQIAPIFRGKKTEEKRLFFHRVNLHFETWPQSRFFEALLYQKFSKAFFKNRRNVLHNGVFYDCFSLSLYHTHYYSPPLPHSTHSHQQHTMGVLYKDNFWPTVNHTGISQYREYLTPSYAPGGYIAPLPLHILYRIAPAGGAYCYGGTPLPSHLPRTVITNHGRNEKKNIGLLCVYRPYFSNLQSIWRKVNKQWPRS